MSDLGELYRSWRNQPFPPGSSFEALDQLHADLVLADTWVAETVIPFVEHGRHEPAHVDVIGELSKLRDRAVQLASTGHEEAQQLANDYREYVELLARVYQGFLTDTQSGRR